MLKSPIEVQIENLYLDRNNPRLAPEHRDYNDGSFLFDADAQEELMQEILNEAHGLQDLIDVIIQQGWCPVDQIIVWEHPSQKGKHVVNEGNRRTTALKQIRGPIHAKAVRDFEKWSKKREEHPDRFREAEDFLQKVNAVIEATQPLTVVPVSAVTAEELKHDLPRILAVRHINSARDWHGYPKAKWLLAQYREYERAIGAPTDAWDGELIKRVSGENSVNPVECKKVLRAVSLYEDFIAIWGEDLPDGEEFKESDFYLFELISQVAWFRDDVLQLGLERRTFTDDASKALFEWVFKLPRGDIADDNDNVFYRHENVRLLNTMRNYDDKTTTTSFAKGYKLEDYQNAPRVREQEARYLQHKNQQGSDILLRDLIEALDRISMGEARRGSEYMTAQLEQLQSIVSEQLRMIRARNG